MQRATHIFVVGILTALLASPVLVSGSNDPSTVAPTTCRSGVPGGVNCIVSKKDKKEARQAFSRGLKLKDQQQLEDALEQFDEAARLVPQDTQFLAAREMVKAQLVYNHMQRGNALLSEGSPNPAATEFRAALNLDPENQFARQQLEESMRARAPHVPHDPPIRLINAGELHLAPKSGQATFHFSGDIKALFTELGAAYGINVQFDDPIESRQVRFNVDDVDFFTALKLACEISKTMWTPLDPHQMFIAKDTPENHKQYDRMSLGTFIMPPHATQAEATEVINTLRTIFDLRFVPSGSTLNVLEVRATQPVLEACSKLLPLISTEKPQVMLDINVYQISHQFMRDIGLHAPNTFNLFNIPAAALGGLGGQSIQQLINQLISSGGINQAGNSTLQALLAQLGGGSGIFSQPLATFGGGLTFMGLSLDHLTASLSVNESWARSLSHVTVLASQGNDSVFKLGERYPIQNASYAPIFNSPQISQVLGNQSYVPPFPSVSYEDIGLNLKAKPTVHGDGTVSMQFEIQVRSLTGTSANGVPVISNREYNGSINLRDGEPAVVAGEISVTDQLSLSGIPGFGILPGLNQIAASNTKEEDDDELMIIITPHIVSDVNRDPPTIYISAK